MIHIDELYDSQIAERKREIEACQQWHLIKKLTSEGGLHSKPRLPDRLIQWLGNTLVSLGTSLQARSETTPALNAP